MEGLGREGGLGDKGWRCLDSVLDSGPQSEVPHNGFY